MHDNVDWLNEPMEGFGVTQELGEDGTWRFVHPFGDGVAPSFVAHIASLLEESYDALTTEEDREHAKQTGEVPVIRGGRRGYEELRSLALKDMPDVLHTLSVLDAERQARDAEKAGLREEKRKARRRELARERRKLKALGEW